MDYADRIVERVMQHTLVLDDDGKPDLSHSAVVAGVVFARCAKGCNVSIGTDDFERVIFRAEEAERRHQLYVAITTTIEFEARLRHPSQQVGRLGVSVPEPQNRFELFSEDRLVEAERPTPRKGGPDPHDMH